MHLINSLESFHHPVSNFNHAGFFGENSEFELGNLFINHLKKHCDDKTVAIREFPVPGRGIADFVLFKRNGNFRNVSNNLTIRAFEFKIKDWRRGLMQAHRYKYFANVSILVIPHHLFKSAQHSLPLFKQLGVGLWIMNKHTGTISKKFTPRPKKALDPNREAYALGKISDITLYN